MQSVLSQFPKQKKDAFDFNDGVTSDLILQPRGKLTLFISSLSDAQSRTDELWTFSQSF